MKTIKQIRDAVEHCRNTDNIGCTELIKYRDQENAEGASHPVLFQIVPKAKIMLIGAVPGAIETKTAYQKLVNAQFSLGYTSAHGLGKIMKRVGKIKGIDLPGDITRLPNEKNIQNNHLLARERLGLHITNLVKCHAPKSWESKQTPTWKQAGHACERKHLTHEVAVVDPSMVILLGQKVAEYFSVSEAWDRKRIKLAISKWAYQACFLPCYGKDRFVTAWVHPASTEFWTHRGKRHWDLYAKQMADYIN